MSHRLKFDLYVDVITEKAKRMGDVIELQWGELASKPPREVEKFFVEAFRGGYVRYTSPYGDIRLREAIRNKLRRKNGIEVDIDNILVTIGGTAAINFAFKVVGERNYIIIQDPSWFGYPGIASYVGVKLYRLREPEYGYDSFRKAYEEIKREGGKLRAIVLNYPSNPTGHIFGESTLREAIDFADDYDITLISDEAYEDYVFKGKHISIASIKGIDNIISVFSLSKTYAFTGLRIGYVVGPKEIIDSMAVAQVHTYISPPSINQYVAKRILEEELERGHVERNLALLRKNLGIVKKYVEKESWEMVEPQGGIYAFIRLPQADSVKFSIALLEEKKVAVAPGIDFGERWKEWIRITIAKSEEEVREGLNRIAELYDAFKKS